MLECLTAFQQWFTANGGWLHSDLELAHEKELGVHVRVKHGASLGPDTRVCSCPASLSFSCLDAVASSSQPDSNPPWLALAASLPPEPVGWFFLVHEYLASASSFWKPYIDTLPSPSAAEQLGTLVYFKDEDLQWLGGTNLLAAHWQRTKAWQVYWEEGLDILRKYHWPVEKYTCFTSQWLKGDAAEYSSVDPARAPDTSPYDLQRPKNQKTYRAYFRTQGHEPTAVTVTLPSANGPFQVLFPILDAFNHDHSAEVNWSFEKDSFTMTVEEPKKQGEEVFNNYGRKANEELLMGYGFCVSQNPWDRFALAFRPPPVTVQNKLRSTRPELFDANGWDSSAGTFYLPSPRYLAQSYYHDPFSFWSALPPTLVELLFHMVMRERGKDVSFVNLKDYLIDNRACWDIFAISRQFLEQVQPMLARITLEKSVLPSTPKNKLQANAQIYRDGQIRILNSVLKGIHTFVQSVRPILEPLHDISQHDCCSMLMTLPEVLDIWQQAFPSAHRNFLAGIERSANTSDVHVLQQAGWEEDIWTLWLCWLLIMHEKEDFDKHGTNGENGDIRSKALIGGWTDWLRHSYLPVILDRVRRGTLGSADPRTRFEALRDVDLGNEGNLAETALADLEDHLNDLLGIVRMAADFMPTSLWGDAMWSGDLIAVWGLRITKYECVERSLLQDDDGGKEGEEGLLMYLHRMDGRHVWLEGEYKP
ncbi:MAG: hypothetical protein Q9157_004110 [Trypethelium eluteriae]